MSEKNCFDSIMDHAASISNIIKKMDLKKETLGGAKPKIGRPKKSSKKNLKEGSKKGSKKTAKKTKKNSSTSPFNHNLFVRFHLHICRFCRNIH
jgi:hypothetical protein